MDIFQAAHEGLAIPDHVDILIPPFGTNIRLYIEVVKHLGEDKSHLVPRHIHAETVTRAHGKGLMGVALIVGILWVA